MSHSEIQSIIFMKNYGWTMNKAKYWLKKHDFKPIKRVHILHNELRYRIREPLYSQYITKKFDDGMMFVIGIHNNDDFYL